MVASQHCPGCREQRPFETPPCDEHGRDCPELTCVVCGWALIGGFELAATYPAAIITTPTRAAATPAS